MSFVYFGKVTI